MELVRRQGCQSEIAYLPNLILFCFHGKGSCLEVEWQVEAMVELAEKDTIVLHAGIFAVSDYIFPLTHETHV